MNCHGAGVVQRLCNDLPRNDPGFNSRWECCTKQASRPSQGTVNDLVVNGMLYYTNNEWL